MITLTIDNSYSTIGGLSAVHEKELKNLLSYDVGSQAAFFSGGHRPRKKTLVGRKGEFPTGLLTTVAGYLVEKNLKFDLQDTRVKPTSSLRHPVLGLDYEPYMAQIDATTAAEEFERGCISMPTGTGKSLVIALIINTLQLKTLVVVPNIEIKKQLIADLKKSFKGPLKYVTVENIDSKALQTFTDFDCLIIDEAHHVAAKTYQKLNKTAWKGIYHRFFLTATPFRNNTEETLLFESIAGQVIYELSYKEAVDSNYIVPVEAFYIELPTVDNDYYTWSEVYSNLVVKNEKRNLELSLLLLKLNAYDKATLCLVKEVAHGEELAAITGFPFVNGKDETTRQYIEDFNHGRTKVLIGTTGILGEGVDTKPCEYVVIAGLGKAKSAFMQQVGRGVRRFDGKESAKIILFKDKSHKFTLRHFSAQAKILKDEYGIKPTKLELESK